MANSGAGALADRSAAGGGGGAQPSLQELNLRALLEPMPEMMLPPGAELEGVECPDADGAGGAGGGGAHAASGEAFASITLVGAGGNALVLWIVAGHKVMRTPTNLFFLNLAWSDVIICVLNFPFVVLYYLDGLHWPFGAAYCHVQQYSATVSCLPSSSPSLPSRSTGALATLLSRAMFFYCFIRLIYIVYK